MSLAIPIGLRSDLIGAAQVLCKFGGAPRSFDWLSGRRIGIDLSHQY
jgi:hypothetical protein